METTWRERVVEARRQGGFSVLDHKLWGSLHTCPVGEALTRYGLYDGHSWTASGRDMYRVLGDPFGSAMFLNDFDETERLLDAIDDRALELKRLGHEC